MLSDDARHGRLAHVVKPRHVGAGLALMTLSAISRRLAASSFLRRPPTRPSARAIVRLRIIARSNSANDPTICIVIRPAGVVVSMFSVIDRTPASALPIRSNPRQDVTGTGRRQLSQDEG